MSKYRDTSEFGGSKNKTGDVIKIKSNASKDYDSELALANYKAALQSGYDAKKAANDAATAAGGWEDLKSQYAPQSQEDEETNAVTPVTSISDAYLQQVYDLGNKIQNRDPFSYDLQADQLYQQYKDQYSRNGQLAMMDTMGQAAGLTGGYGSTYAQNAGQQAYQGYMNELNAIVPDLYNNAYNKYNNETEQLYNQYNAAKDMYSTAAGIESAQAQAEADAEQTAWDRQMELWKNNLAVDENGNIVKSNNGVEYSISNGYLLGSDGSVQVLGPNASTKQSAAEKGLIYDEESGDYYSAAIDGMSTDDIDYAVVDLKNKKSNWATMSLEDRLKYVDKKLKNQDYTGSQRAYARDLITQAYQDEQTSES